MKDEMENTPKGRRIGRRRFLQLGGASVAGAALLGVAGCGGGSEQGATTSGDATTSGGTRTVELAGGTVEVPTNPQRVVVLQSFVLPHVLSMGVKPVAVGLSDATVAPNEILPPWLDTSLPENVTTFSEQEPNLELISRLDPDLIVAFRATDNIEQIRQIALVAVIDRIAMQWRELTEGVARVFGEEERFDRFMADYKARVSEFRNQTLPALGDQTVPVFRVRGPNELRIEVLDSFPGQILADAGVRRPEAQNRKGDTGFGYLEVSLERLAMADADLMFAITYDRRPQTKEDLRAMAQTPIWQEIVQDSQVHEIDGATWFGGHPLAAIALLDDLTTAVRGNLTPFRSPTT